MAEATPVVVVDDDPFDHLRFVTLGYLVSYKPATRKLYEAHLRMWFDWCRNAGIPPLQVQRAHVELWMRTLEEAGRKPATIAHKVSILAGFYRYAEEEDVIARNPVSRVRRPKIPDDSTRSFLDREELGAFLTAASLSQWPTDHALAALLGINGLRVAEACGADIEGLAMQRGHRTLNVTRKGGHHETIPLPPRVARAIDLAIGERAAGPLLLTREGTRLNRHAAARIVNRLAKRAGITHHISPHSLRRAAITAALDAGVPLRDVQQFAHHADPRTTTRYDMHRQSLDKHAAYVIGAFVASAAR